MAIVDAQARIAKRESADAGGPGVAREIAADSGKAIVTTTRPLRVVVFASSYNYIKDGFALTLNHLVDYLERNGDEVLVVAPIGPAPAFAHKGTLIPVPSVPLPARPEYRFALGIPSSVRDRLRSFAPDIMHVALSPDLLGYRALRLAKSWNVPAVASYHTRYETYLKHYWYVSWAEGILHRYMRSAYAEFREVYVPSQSMTDALLAAGFKNNLRLWPRGVDSVLFSPEKRSDAWRARYGIADDEVVVVHVARLVREKKLDTLVTVARALEAHGTPHRILIVGDGPERGSLERQLPDAIFTGFLDGEDLSTAYASSDVFLFASETESFGNVTLEAMASGLPCVCADATGSRSLVVEGETGHLADTPDDFVRYVVELVDDGPVRRRMGAAARQRSLAFSWDEVMERIRNYYISLLSEAAL